MFGLTPEQLAQIEAQKNELEPKTCAICDGEILRDKLYLSIGPDGGEVYGKKFHPNCIISHFYINVDKLDDATVNYILRPR